MRKISVAILLSISFMMFMSVNVSAQEISPSTPTAEITQEAPFIVVVPPQDNNNSQPDVIFVQPPPQYPYPAPESTSSELSKIILIFLALGGVGFGFWQFFKKNPNATPAQLDEYAASELGELQANRPFVESAEQYYANTSDMGHIIFDSTEELVDFVANHTSIKTADAAQKLLKDVKVVGPPEPEDSDWSSGPPTVEPGG